MAGTINTQAQLQVSSSATYTTNAANLITAGLVRTFNENWISSSLLIPMTSSMTVLSSSYAATASVLIGSVVSSSYAYTASSATNAGTSISASFALRGEGAFTGSFSGSISASFSGSGVGIFGIVSSSYAYTASSAVAATSASFAVSASYANNFLISGSFIVTGSAVTKLIPITVASNTASIDCISGNLFSFTLGAASTTHIAFSNIKEGQTGNLLITTAATSTASFSSNVKQISGSQYTATSGSGQTDLLSFATVGSSVYVVNSKKFV